MAPVGQAGIQAPQLMHLPGSMTARLLSMKIAPLGQVLTHFPQPMHAALQVFRAVAPLSWLEHSTTCVTLVLTILINPLGHALAQDVHPVHLL